MIVDVPLKGGFVGVLEPADAARKNDFDDLVLVSSARLGSRVRCVAVKRCRQQIMQCMGK